jgi:hypothetical protein
MILILIKRKTIMTVEGTPLREEEYYKWYSSNDEQNILYNGYYNLTKQLDTNQTLQNAITASASHRGHVRIFKLGLSRGWTTTISGYIASIYGHLNILKLLSKVDKSDIVGAFERGYRNIIYWYSQTNDIKDLKIDQYFFVTAIRTWILNCKICRLLETQIKDCVDSLIFQMAISNKQLYFVRQLVKYRKVTKNHINLAKENNDIVMIKLLTSKV